MGEQNNNNNKKNFSLMFWSLGNPGRQGGLEPGFPGALPITPSQHLKLPPHVGLMPSGLWESPANTTKLDCRWLDGERCQPQVEPAKSIYCNNALTIQVGLIPLQSPARHWHHGNDHRVNVFRWTLLTISETFPWTKQAVYFLSFFRFPPPNISRKMNEPMGI